MTSGLALSRAVAVCAGLSRRVAFGAVVSGRVSVNGHIIRSPAVKLSEEDCVTLDGEVLGPPPDAADARLWKYHKPRGLVTTHKDPQGRPTVFGSLPGSMPRVVSAGRLDAESEGLLMLTTFSPLARLLELPSSGFVRSYRALLATGKRSVTKAMLEELSAGLKFPDGFALRPVIARVEPRGTAATGQQWVGVDLTEGKNREVRRIWEHFGFATLALIRTEYGPFALGELRPGEIEEVPSSIVQDILKRTKGDARGDASDSGS
jgi:23S rRNA pseudouridine2605 synthase